MRAPAAALITFLLLSVPPPAASQQLQPAEVLEAVGIDQRLGARLPAGLRFRDESGAEVRLVDYFGDGPVILMPVYYECPMLCSVAIEALVAALKTLDLEVGEDFDVVTFSIDPGETPAMAAAGERRALARYGRDPSVAAGGWHALVGDQQSIGELTAAIGFRYLYDEDRDEYAHVSGVMVLTPDGRLARYLYGVTYSARDLRLALVEAAGGGIGSVADQVLLLCFHYDPVSGRYGFAIWSAIRVLGLATVILLGSGVWLMLRRERRNEEGTDG